MKEVKRKPSAIDWSKVDFSKQNAKLARVLGVSYAVVAYYRRILGKPKATLHRSQGLNPILKRRWLRMDWRQSDKVLGAKMGVSRQRAAQWRVSLGKPKPTIKPKNGSAKRRLRRRNQKLLALLPTLEGMTREQAEKATGLSLGRGSSAREFIEKHLPLRPKTSLHPWHRMNFDLGDTDLARIWNITLAIVSARRRSLNFGPARWRQGERKAFSDQKERRAYHEAIRRQERLSISVKRDCPWEMQKARRLLKLRRSTRDRNNTPTHAQIIN